MQLRRRCEIPEDRGSPHHPSRQAAMNATSTASRRPRDTTRSRAATAQTLSISISTEDQEATSCHASSQREDRAARYTGMAAGLLDRTSHDGGGEPRPCGQRRRNRYFVPAAATARRQSPPGNTDTAPATDLRRWRSNLVPRAVVLQDLSGLFFSLWDLKTAVGDGGL